MSLLLSRIPEIVSRRNREVENAPRLCRVDWNFQYCAGGLPWLMRRYGFRRRCLVLHAVVLRAHNESVRKDTVQIPLRSIRIPYAIFREIQHFEATIKEESRGSKKCRMQAQVRYKELWNYPFLIINKSCFFFSLPPLSLPFYHPFFRINYIIENCIIETALNIAN